MKTYTPEEIEIIKSNYKTKGNVEIGLMIKRSADGVKHQMNRQGIRRTKAEVLALKKKPNSGHYKKGRVPHNANFNGHERLTKDGYVEIRISQGDYRLKHRVVWEIVNGKIPDNHIIIFKDGNPQNTIIENLELITMIENMYKNSRQNYPKEIIPSLVLNRKLENKLNTLLNG